MDVPENLVPEIHLAALFFHNKIVGFYEGHNAPDSSKTDILTRRQIECLTWVADGKTDWEIGEILSIQESTVHSHIKDPKKKLGAVTRAQAVVEAFKAGLIGL